MDQDLARIYNTAGAGNSNEDLEKEAQAELFAKLAADNNLDLTRLSDEQISDLWNQTFPSKTAEEKCAKCKMAMGECKCPPEGSKEAAAQAEFEAQQEERAKFAEAEQMGRRMAHAYVDELNKIAGAGGLPPQFQKKDDSSDEEEEKDEKKEANIHPAAAQAMRDLAATQKSASVPQTKTASSTPAIDNLAIERAVKLAAASGFDPGDAAQRLSALVTLRQFPSGEKTASAERLEDAVEIRALEFLETAGYPVTWGQGE